MSKEDLAGMVDPHFKECFDVVSSINDDLENKDVIEYLRCSLVTDGFCFVIKIADCVLWNSEDDDRTVSEHRVQDLEEFVRAKITSLSLKEFGFVAEAMKKNG